MACVHNQNQAYQLFALLEIITEQLDPVSPYCFRNLCITVAGQVNQEITVLKLEEVDMLRPSGCLGNISEADMVCQGVDSTGFSGIAPADEGNFERGVGQVFKVVDRCEELGVLKKIHGHILVFCRRLTDSKNMRLVLYETE